MPTNRFPDSREKRELRRRVRRKLIALSELFPNRYAYCGLPSVEFLDVACWRDQLRSVMAFENDVEATDDMLIQLASHGFTFPVTINPDGETDILAFLLESKGYAFDLYNLDLFGGLVYKGEQRTPRAVNAIRQLLAEQARVQRSFVMVSTFNLRNQGAKEYQGLLDKVRGMLRGRTGADANMKAHDADNATRLKLCFPFFCAQQVAANGFKWVCEEVVTYRSSVSLVSFTQVFRYEGLGLMSAPVASAIVELANRPLLKMCGQVIRERTVFPSISE